MLRASKHCLFFIFFVSAVAQQPDDGTNIVIDSEPVEDATLVNANNIQGQKTLADHALFEQCKEFFIDVAQIETLELIIFSFATIVHELGHAITAKFLFDTRDSIKIHVGTRNPKAIPQFFSLGNMYFYKTIPWVRGLTEFRYRKQGSVVSENIKLGIFTVAGSLADVAFLGMVQIWG